MKRLAILLAMIGTLAASLGATVWGLKSWAPGGSTPSGPPTNLFHFEENGSGFVDVGSVTMLGLGLDADALAMNAAGGLYAYVLSSSASSLVTVDPGTAVATEVSGGSLDGRDIRGAMFDGLGRLFVLDALTDELIQINPATGAIIGSPIGLAVGGVAYDVHTGTDLALRADGSVRFVSYNQFYSLDLSTGALTHEFTDTTSQYDGSTLTFHPGLAFTVAGGMKAFTYEANGNDDIYSYDTGGGYTRSLLITNIIPSFNSGRGDLAAAPVPEPVSAAVFGVALAALGVRRRR